jgi:hypothetical protein
MASNNTNGSNDFVMCKKTNLPLILPFSKSQYLVPQSYLRQQAKKSNKVSSAEELSSILNTKAPSKWTNYLHPDTLYEIGRKDGSGSSIYTTFELEDNEDECRILRVISKNLAAKVFPKIRSGYDEDFDNLSDRQKRRLEILNWTGEDLGNKAQLGPEIEGFQPLPFANFKVVSSSKVSYETYKKANTKLVAADNGTSGSSASAKRKFVVNEHFLALTSKKYRITELGNIIHVVEYSDACTNASADSENALAIKNEESIIVADDDDM